MGGIYILKNDLMISRLKNLMISLMALQAELRGKEREYLGHAVEDIRKTMEILK